MPEKTYILRFDLLDGTREEQEHTVSKDAWAAFRLFAEPDSMDMYSVIELVCHDWDEDSEKVVVCMKFYK